MKGYFSGSFKIVAIFITFTNLGLATNQGLYTPKTLPAYKPVTFHPRKPDRLRLPNGMTLFFLEDHSVPLVQFDVMVRSGRNYESSTQSGISTLLAKVLSHGGSESYNTEQTNAILDRTAALLSFEGEADQIKGSLTIRSTDQEILSGLFIDLVQHPSLPEKWIELERRIATNDVRALNDSPWDLAWAVFNRMIYGKKSPYGRRSTLKSFEAIHRTDLLAWYQTCFVPTGLWISVSGDFDRAIMEQKFRTAFTEWPGGAGPGLGLTPELPLKGKHVAIIPKSLTQSTILMGQRGLKLGDPDHFAWEIFDRLLGGGEYSLIWNIARVQKGLAYEGGSLSIEHPLTGAFIITTQTQTAQTVPLVKLLLEICEKAKTLPFSGEEILAVKNGIVNAWIQKFGNSQDTVREWMAADFEGLPQDYLDEYVSRINGVTREDLIHVARRLTPSDFNIAIVGAQAPELSTLAPDIKVMKANDILEDQP